MMRWGKSFGEGLADFNTLVLQLGQVIFALLSNTLIHEQAFAHLQRRIVVVRREIINERSQVVHVEAAVRHMAKQRTTRCGDLDAEGGSCHKSGSMAWKESRKERGLEEEDDTHGLVCRSIEIFREKEFCLCEDTFLQNGIHSALPAYHQNARGREVRRNQNANKRKD